MTGIPGVPLPDGWVSIPGAAGCTPQSCGFRDHYSELKTLAASVFGLSAQTSAYQKEARDRLHLPFELLSDSNLRLKQLLALPTFSVAGMELYKPLTLVVENNRIQKVFYPVFPPAKMWTLFSPGCGKAPNWALQGMRPKRRAPEFDVRDHEKPSHKS